MSSAITTPPAKITLPSTSKMSLHDRFTKLAKTRPASAKPASVASAVSPVVKSAVAANVTGMRASAKNRKLALQMASRPSVQAALKIKNKSIKQRLGTAKPIPNSPTQSKLIKIYKPVNAASNVKSRLSGNNVGAGIDPARLSLPANPGGARFQSGDRRLGRGGTNRRSLNASLETDNSGNYIKRVGAGGGIGIKGGRRSLKGRLGNAATGLNTNFRKVGNQGTRGRRPGGPNRVNNRPGKNPVAGPQQQQQQQQQQQPPKSRENLDMDLDQYMAKSKSHLDHDLDAYMAQNGGQ